MKKMNNEIALIDDNISYTDNLIVQSQEKFDFNLTKSYSMEIIRYLKNNTIENIVRKRQIDFENSLNWFQKNIPFVRTGEEQNNNTTKKIATAINTSAEILLCSTEWLLEEDQFQKLKNKVHNVPQMLKTLTFAYLFVNDVDCFEFHARGKLITLMKKSGIKNSDKKINEWTENYCKKPSQDFTLPTDFIRIDEYKYLFIKLLCKLCSTEDIIDVTSSVYNKVKSIYEIYFEDDSMDNFYSIVNNCYRESDLLTSTIDISLYSINEMIGEVIKNTESVNRKLEYITMSNPLREKRENSKKKLMKTLPSLLAGGLTFFTGPVGDFLIATAGPLVYNSLNEEDCVNKKDLFEAYNEIMNSLHKKVEKTTNLP
jgi:hypothetical protein